MEDIYIIISKYLLGTASPQEEKEIMEWRNADAGARTGISGTV